MSLIELDNLSIDDVDLALRARDALVGARAAKKKRGAS